MSKLKYFSLFLLLVWCSTTVGDYRVGEDVNGLLFNIDKDQSFEFVDLSYIVDEGKNFGYRSTDFCVDVDREEDNWNYYNHHFTTKNKAVKDVSLNNLIIPLIIADISGKVNGDANFVLYKHHLDYFLNNYFGRTYQPCLIVFKFGWTKHYNYQLKYDFKGNGTLHYPGMSEEVAKWITTAYKNVVGVGVDLPSVDPESSNGSPAFEALTKAGVYVLQNVKLDQYLPEASCTALVLPVKVKGNCSPYRLAAICPKSRMKRPEIRLHRL